MAADVGPQEVAVVGGGWAGLTTALFATSAGYKVTVYHADPLDQSVSYWGGGGLTSYNPPTLAGLEEVRVNFLGVPWTWLAAFFYNFVIYESATKSNMVALADASINELKRIGFSLPDYVECIVPKSDNEERRDAETPTDPVRITRFFNIMRAMENARGRLVTDGARFIQEEVADLEQLVSAGYVHVFACRGVRDADVFGRGVAIVAGTSTDFERNTFSRTKCFEFAQNMPVSGIEDATSDQEKFSAFISSFPDRDRVTLGAYFGYKTPPTTIPFSGDARRREQGSFHGARLNTSDTLPFYLRATDHITYVNGGSFNGLHTYPVISAEAVRNALPTISPAGATNFNEAPGSGVKGFDASFSRVGNQMRLGVVTLILFLMALMLVIRIIFGAIRAVWFLVRSKDSERDGERDGERDAG